MLEKDKLIEVLEAILLTSGKAMSEKQLLDIFEEEERPNLSEIRTALFDLQEIYQNRAINLIEVGNGYRFQAKVETAPWIGKLFEEKPPRYSRALLETLALIAYRQPVTRGEIEEIRGVSVSSSIFRTLMEDRNWIRVVGQKDVPGKPSLYATTKDFLDYFGLKSLDALPALPDIMELTDPSSGKEDSKPTQGDLLLQAFDDELELEQQRELEEQNELNQENEVLEDAGAFDEEYGEASGVSDDIEEDLEEENFEFEVDEVN